MANTAPGDIYRCILYSMSTNEPNSQVGMNILHYICTSITGAGATQAKARDDMDGTLSAVLKPCLNANALYFGLSWQLIFPAPRLQTITTVANQGAGTGGSNTLPTQVAGLISKLTGMSGPGYHGRSYIPFPGTGDDDDPAVPSDAYFTALTALAAQMAAPITVGSTGAQAVMTPGLYAAGSNRFVVLTSAYGSNAWATQRRRGAFGRINSNPF